MSIRKYSTDNGDRNNDIAYDSAFVLSDRQLLFAKKSVAIKQTIRSSTHEFSTYSVNQAISSVTSSTVKYSIQSNEKIIHSHNESQDQETRRGNTEELSPVDSEVEIKTKINPTRECTNYIQKIDLCETKGKNDDALFSNFDAPSNDSETKEFGATFLEQSNIWPALTALDITLTKTSDNTSTDHSNLIESLTEQFSYSPREFTETLLTILEESVVKSGDESDDFDQFLKKAVNDDSENPQLLKEISGPKLAISQTSNEHSNAVTKYGLTESGTGSTKYLSFKKLMSPKFHPKTYRRSLRLDIGEKTPIKVQASKEVSQIKSGVAKINHPKPAGLMKIRGTRQNSLGHRLEVTRESNITPYQKSPRQSQKLVKTPKIIITPVTPRNSAKKRRFPVQDSDEDEYLTAESEPDDLGTFHQAEKPVEIETEEPNVTRRKKAFDNESVIHRSSALITKTTDTQTKTLEKDWLQQLRQKRQLCLDLAKQLFKKEDKVGLSIEEENPSVRKPSNHTVELINTLRACSEYFAYSMHVRNVRNLTENTSACFSNLSMNIMKNKDLSTRHLSVQQSKARSTKKPLGMKNMKITSPGAKCLSLYSKSRLKRQSLKGSRNSGIDTSSLRPVSELRCLFSPRKLAADGSTSKATLIRGPITESTVQKSIKNQRKFKHVISPVGQYIRGNKATLLD